MREKIRQLIAAIEHFRHHDPGRKSAMIAVYAMATWMCVAINFVVWEGLPLVRHLLGWHMAEINYQLSVWPVLIDMIILMSSVIWTAEQLQIAKSQTSLLDAQTAQAEAMHVLIRQGADRDAKLEQIMTAVYGDVHEMKEDVEDIVDELTAPEADVIVTLETPAQKHAREAATKRGESE